MKRFEASVKIEQYIIEDVAILEVRHFNRELGVPYHQVIFLNKEKVIEHLHGKHITHPIYTDCRLKAHIKPPETYKYIEIETYKTLLDQEDYFTILLCLFEKSSNFYETNIIFPYLYSSIIPNKENINKIGNLLLQDFNLKSFAIRRYKANFLNDYGDLLRNELKEKIMRYITSYEL